MAKGSQGLAAATATTTNLPAMHAGFTPEQKELIRTQIARGCTDDEIALFLHVCQTRGLDPLTKQIYAIKRGGQMTIQVAIDGARSIAAKTGRYMPGREAKYEHDGRSLKSATVYAKVMAPDGSWHEISDSAYMVEYMGGTPLWKKMPRVMLSKCAEMRLLRRAFPDNFGGIYEQSEMDQADHSSAGLSGDSATNPAAAGATVPALDEKFPELVPVKPAAKQAPVSPPSHGEKVANEVFADAIDASMTDDDENYEDADVVCVPETPLPQKPVTTERIDDDVERIADKVFGPPRASANDLRKIRKSIKDAGLDKKQIEPKICAAYDIEALKELPLDKVEQVLSRVAVTARQAGAA